MTRLVAFYENVQEAYGSEPEYGYTDFDHQKSYIYTHDLFSRMQRVCLVSRTPFLEGHVKVLSLAICWSPSKQDHNSVPL